MVDKGSELTFTLSANTGYKVKTLTIDGTTYSDVTDNSITKTVKIEKDTAVSGTAEAISTPPSPEPQEELDAGSVFNLQENGGEFKLTGSICIDDINSAKFIEDLKKAEGKNIDTSTFKINCFKTPKRSTQSVTTRNVTNSYISKEITPKILQAVLKLKENRKFSTLTLNNQTSNGPIDIKFDSNEGDFFDIKDLNKFSFSNNFKLDSKSEVIVGSKETTKQTDPSDHDITPYPKVDDLLKLLGNETLKGDIIVKDVYITGNVKDLLPKLIGPNKIKETNGGVKFLNVQHFTCPGPNVTEYDGGKDNTEPLPVEQLLEFRRRTDILKDEVLEKDTRSTRIQNLVLNNIDTTTMSQENLELLNFEGNSVAGNITFKNSNLSKMQYKGTTGPVDLTFDNTTLPIDMEGSEVSNLILKNTILAEELQTASLSILLENIPNINDSLKIYNLQNKILDKWTESEIIQAKQNWNNLGNSESSPPYYYVGPKEVWTKLKYLFLENGKTTKTHFTNEDLTNTPLDQINFSSIQKIKANPVVS